MSDQTIEETRQRREAQTLPRLYDKERIDPAPLNTDIPCYQPKIIYEAFFSTEQKL